MSPVALLQLPLICPNLVSYNILDFLPASLQVPSDTAGRSTVETGGVDVDSLVGAY